MDGDGDGDGEVDNTSLLSEMDARVVAGRENERRRKRVRRARVRQCLEERRGSSRSSTESKMDRAKAEEIWAEIRRMRERLFS